MGAHKLDDHFHKIIYPACVQKKLDGFRCLVNNTTLYSKSMKPFIYLSHIKKELALLKLNNNIYLDGELYEFGLGLHEISSLVHHEGHEISYYIFDMFDLKNMKMPFYLRYSYLESLFRNHKFKYLKLVQCVSVNNYNKILELNNKYLLEGYEGVIVRNMEGIYKLNSKSYDVLRTKEFKKGKFMIIGAKEGSGTQKGAIIWQLQCHKSGHSFFALPIGTINERIKIYKKYFLNPSLYIGKYATVKYLELTKDGCVSRNPIVEKID
jgi:DNA ligase-1